jgi:hypothetical protein
MGRKFVIKRDGKFVQDDSDEDSPARLGPLGTAYVYDETEWYEREIGESVGGEEQVIEVEISVREIGRVDPFALFELIDLSDEFPKFVAEVTAEVRRHSCELLTLRAFSERQMLHGVVLAYSAVRSEWITWQTARDARQFNGLFWGHYGFSSVEAGMEDFLTRQKFHGMHKVGEFKAP